MVNKPRTPHIPLHGTHGTNMEKDGHFNESSPVRRRSSCIFAAELAGTQLLEIWGSDLEPHQFNYDFYRLVN